MFTCDDGYIAQTPGSMYEATCLDGKFVFEKSADCAKKSEFNRLKSNLKPIAILSDAKMQNNPKLGLALRENV